MAHTVAEWVTSKRNRWRWGEKRLMADKPAATYGPDPLDRLKERSDGLLETVYAELCVKYPDLPEQAARLRAERPVRQAYRYTAKEAAARSRRATGRGRPRKTVVPSA